MAIPAANRAIWEEIERSESYLVSCMFEEAASLATSVLKNLCHNKFLEAGQNSELNDMVESAGMVLVQSLKELGRTEEISNELKLLFGSIAAVPVEVFLAGVCLQISEGPCPAAQESLEEYLREWRCVDEQHYVVANTESIASDVEGFGDCVVLGVEKYLEVVEMYVVTLLGMVLRDIDRAIAWVDKAALPEEKRQGLLRRLHSLYSPNAPGSSQGSDIALPADESEARLSSLKEQKIPEGFAEPMKVPYPFKGESDRKQAILELSQRRVPCFWWFRNITLKFGNCRLVISNGKIVLGCLLILMYFLLQRKQAALKRVLKKQALSMKKGLVDLWQLMFSYQVNPLAAVQPLPAAAHGSR